MEKNITIKTPYKFVIYGTLNTYKNISDKLIIFVHGFTGHMNEHFLYNAAQFFPKNRFDTFRFNLYGYENNARKLTNTSTSEHIKDFETVLNYFKNKYKKIYAVGHSLGAHVVLRADQNILDSVVLWEPSQEPKDIVKDLKYSKPLSVYIEHSNVDILIGKNFVEDTKKLSPINNFLSKFIKPIKIIGAQKAGARIGKNIYFENANKPKEFYLIKNSRHTFDEKGAEAELFRETLNWFKKY